MMRDFSNTQTLIKELKTNSCFYFQIVLIHANYQNYQIGRKNQKITIILLFNLLKMSFQEQPIDFLSQVDIPPWIMEKTDHIEDPFLYLELSDHIQNNKSHNSTILNSCDKEYVDKKNNSIQHKKQASYEIGYRDQTQKSSQGMSDQQDSSQNYPKQQKSSKINKNGFKNIKQRRNQTSRKYRQRRKQFIKNLQNENKFLRFKIDELQFRLHEIETQMNKLKINTSQHEKNIPGYHTIKSQCLYQLQILLANNIKDHNAYQKIQQKLNSVVAFDGKQKIDLLNYFMSELMENVISDKIFYFTEGLIKKTGLHRVDQTVPFSQLDNEVSQIVEVDYKLVRNVIKQSEWNLYEEESRKFQVIWKKLYQVYLAILNQGFKMEAIMTPLKKRMQGIMGIQNMLRLDLHFQKNKYRSDIREMRSLWFRELERENLQKEQLRVIIQ